MNLGEVKSGQDKLIQVKSAQVRTGQVKTRQAGQVSTRQNGQVLLGTQVWPYSVLLVSLVYLFLTVDQLICLVVLIPCWDITMTLLLLFIVVL